MSKDNFYSLLTEQDYLGVIKNLSIPFLDKINEELKLSIEKQKQEYDIRSLEKFMLSFHSNYSYTSDLYNLIRNFSIDRRIIIKKAIERRNNLGIELTKEEQQQLDLMLAKLLKELKVTIPKTIKQLKDHLKEETQSDTNIIDLI